MRTSDRELEPDSLDARLRAGARSFAPAPPPGLRARILAEVRATPRPASRPARGPGHGGWLAAAAALLVLGSAWWLTRPTPVASPRFGLAMLPREVREAGSLVMTLPRAVEGNLRLEAERLLDDSARVARDVVNGLPAALRARVGRL